jgi:hypothetical protein
MTGIRLGRQLPVACVVSAVCVLSCLASSAHADPVPPTPQSGATLVAIVTAEPNAPLTRRVRAELEGLGLDVIVIRPPDEASPSRAPLDQAARNVGAVAAVRLVVSSEGKVEVWVADRVTGKSVVRELDASESASDAAVAVGTVELFRASLMELHAVDAPHGDAPATDKLRALALPVSSSSFDPRLGIAVGGAIDLGLRGLGPSADATLGVWARLEGRLGLRAFGYATLSPAHVTTASGAIDVRSQTFGAMLAYDLAAATASWVPSVSLGAAASHVSSTGTAAPPFVGTTDDTWVAGPAADLGLAWAFVRGLRLRADARGAVAFDAPSIRTPAGRAATFAAPLVALSLAAEVMWAP